MEKVRCMLADAKLDKKFWAEAAKTAIYLKNVSPTKAVIGKTPLEAWAGKPVDLSYSVCLEARHMFISQIPSERSWMTKVDNLQWLVIVLRARAID
jgi:hypothetical protein